MAFFFASFGLEFPRKGLFRGENLSGREREERDMPELEKRGDKKFFFSRVFSEHSIVTVDLINK